MTGSGRLLGIKSDWAWVITAKKNIMMKVIRNLFTKPPSDRNPIRIIPAYAFFEN